MKYRRFGRTELEMPVVSCGGMRYQQGWGDTKPGEVTDECQKNLEACIHRALELGVNHIETARGYGTSEYQLGRILPTLPRNEMIIQTKVGIADTKEAFLENFETSMGFLKLDYVDLLGLHGINNRDVFEKALSTGQIAAARQLQKEGRVRHVGFSTHAHNDPLVDVVNSGEFDYINLHYYYVDQRNLPTIEAATKQDMGVFIISPSDKGGMLYKPSDKLRSLCEPLHPITFNGLWCLNDPRIHTLSCGVAKPEEFDELAESAALLDEADELLPPILAKLDAAMKAAHDEDWLSGWRVNLPFFEDVPGEVALYHTLRLYTLHKAFDMPEYATSRYNLLGNGGHWFPGYKVDKMEWDKLPAALEGSPVADRIPDILKEAHDLFKGEEKKRLSES